MQISIIQLKFVEDHNLSFISWTKLKLVCAERDFAAVKRQSAVFEYVLVVVL